LAAFFIADAYQAKLRYALLLPFVYMPMHFVYAVNVTHSKVWAWEHIPRKYFNTVLAAPATNGYPPIVSGYKMRTLTWAYFTMCQNAKQNQIQETNFKNNLYADFIITRHGEVDSINSYYTELDFDEVSGLGLFKRKTAVVRTLLFENTLPDMQNTAKEYIDFCGLATDTLAGENLLFEMDCKVKVPYNGMPNARLVIDIINPDGKSQGYYYQQLDWLYGPQPNGEYTVKQSFIIPAVKGNGYKLAAYYWNIDKKPINFTGGHIRAYTVK
jgi:hypothetical protein